MSLGGPQDVTATLTVFVTFSLNISQLNTQVPRYPNCPHMYKSSTNTIVNGILTELSRYTL